jgi:alpha-1,2-mannosyltransferase
MVQPGLGAANGGAANGDAANGDAANGDRAAAPGRRSRFGAPSTTRRRLGLVIVLGVLFAIGHAWYGNRHGYYDLKIYARAMRWWLDGHRLARFRTPDATQGQLGFTYPPFAALLLWPLGILPLWCSIAGYTVVSVVAFGLIMWWLVAPLAARTGQPAWFLVCLAAILATGLEPIREAYTFGQINLLLWLLIVADLLVLQPRGSRWTGVGIGLATAIKLVPGMFILYLLACRRWRAAAVAGGTAILATVLAAAIAPADSWTFWTSTALHAEGVGQLDYVFNQSVMGVLARLGTTNQLLWSAICLPLLGFGLWRAARAATELAGLTLTGVAGSLVSPVTWVHHLFWFVPALVVLVDAALRAHGGQRPAGSGLSAPAAWWTIAAVTYLTVTFSVISLYAFTLGTPGGLPRVILGNWDVILLLVLVFGLPIRRDDR